MRYNCEFNNCNCRKYKKQIYSINNCSNKICLNCKHAKLWHSKKDKPPNDFYLSFVSPRAFARKPVYERINIPIIFIPDAPQIIDSDEELPYCECIEILPV